MKTIIREHNCTANPAGSTAAAKYQDTLYGKGQRVFNLGAKLDKGKSKDTAVTCTVCGTRIAV